MTRVNERDLESLSAYLDGQLDAAERTRLESKLQQEPELQRMLADLRRTRTILRSQPRPRAPRNFTLTREMVGQYRRRSENVSWYQRFSLTSALASLALVLVLLGDFLGLGARVAAPLLASAPVGYPAPSLGTAVGDSALSALEAAPATTESPVEAGVEAVITEEVALLAEPADSATAVPETLLKSAPAEQPLPVGGTPTPQVEMAVVPTEAAIDGQVFKVEPETEERARDAYPAPESPALEALQPDAYAPPTGLQADGQALSMEMEQPTGIMTPLRLAAIGLALVAVLSALAAFLFWRKNQA
jgi:predicted anti-sigma-YlaC factor YlaD